MPFSSGTYRDIKAFTSSLPNDGGGKGKYIGKRFGMLTILRYIPVDEHEKMFPQLKFHDSYFECLCECGKIVIKNRRNMKAGKTISCGCFKTEKMKAFYEKNKLSPGEAKFHSLYQDYKNGAQKRNLAFELDMDQFRTLTKGNCFYCGDPPSNAYKATHGNYNGTYIYNGVDRIDNKTGYILDNVVPCCKSCNYMKHTLGYSDFIKKINQIYEHTQVRIIKSN